MLTIFDLFNRDTVEKAILTGKPQPQCAPGVRARGAENEIKDLMFFDRLSRDHCQTELM